MSVKIITGDCREVLRTLPDESVHCVVTSPPYWGLRDYGNGSGGIGLEETVAEHMEVLTALFRDVRRIMRADGTLWLNYGDAYAGSWGAQGRGDKRSEMEIGGRIEGENRKNLSEQRFMDHPKRRQTGSLSRTGGCKAKDLMGLPWHLAFSLRNDGWYLRQDIIWAKPNPMPESVTDRCTKAHEYLFLLSKSARYFFDAAAIKTPFSAETKGLSFETMDYKRRDVYRAPGNVNPAKGQAAYEAGDARHRTKAGLLSYAEKVRETPPTGANKRSVWTVATEAFSEAHFATFPPALIEPCILAGCPTDGTVLDPFGGAGTTGLVADRLGRNAILIELNPAYVEIAERRIRSDAPLLCEVVP